MQQWKQTLLPASSQEFKQKNIKFPLNPNETHEPKANNHISTQIFREHSNTTQSTLISAKNNRGFLHSSNHV
jgi:hypothetical protein